MYEFYVYVCIYVCIGVIAYICVNVCMTVHASVYIYVCIDFFSFFFLQFTE